jgi:hypothetical protein
MVVVAIPSHNLGRAQSHSFRASPPPHSPEDTTHQLSSPISFAHASKHSIDSGIAFPQPPTPISPPSSTVAMDAASPTNELREPANPFEHVQVEEPAELDYDQHDKHDEHGYEHGHEHEHEYEQGDEHDHEHDHNEAGPSGSRSIPPPATFKAAGLSMTASKSWGDLSVVGSSGGLLMSTGSVEPSETHDEGQHRVAYPDAPHREEKRVFSDPSRRASEADDAVWDNRWVQGDKGLVHVLIAPVHASTTTSTLDQPHVHHPNPLPVPHRLTTRPSFTLAKPHPHRPCPRSTSVGASPTSPFLRTA